MTREERREYMQKWKTEHPGKYREYHRKRRAEHREECTEYMRKYHAEDLSSSGKKKCCIRAQSNRYLSRKHSKLEGYEIHHCFGYDDFRKFIYIPRTLHLQIHKILKDNKISSDMDHWMAIRDLVNSCDQYTYISA